MGKLGDIGSIVAHNMGELIPILDRFDGSGKNVMACFAR